MKGYHIIELANTGSTEDVGRYLQANRVRFTIRSATKIDADIDLKHLAGKKVPSVFFIYTTRIEEELALLVSLKFADVVVSPIKEVSV